MKKTIFLDGQFIKVSSQLIEAFTPGVFKAKGVFETLLALDGVPLDIEKHLQRLSKGLKVLGIAKPRSIKPAIFIQLLHLNPLECARVRLMVWQQGKDVHVMATALPYQYSRKNILKVCLVQTNRVPSSRLAQVKSLDYQLFADAYQQAQMRGFDEALLLNRRGYIFEASRSNIFWVKQGCLYTTPLSSGCLNGITRQNILHMSRQLKISVQERPLTPFILKNADSAFLTNSLMGLMPIEFRNID